MTEAAVTPERQAEAFARLTDAIDGVVALVQVADGGDPRLVEQLVSAHQAVCRLSGVRAILAARLDASGRWREQGARSFTRYLVHGLGILPATARAMAQLGAKLGGFLPALGRAVLGGEVDLDHAALAAKVACRTPAHRDALATPIEVEVEMAAEKKPAVAENEPSVAEDESAVAEDESAVVMGAKDGADQGEQADTELAAGADSGDDIDVAADSSEQSPQRPRRRRITVTMAGEEHLAYLAATLSAEDYRRVLAHWSVRVDPESLEEAYREAEDREYVELAKTLGGYHLAGFLSEKTGQLFKTALESVHTPPALADERTSSQRRATDLARLSQQFLDAGLGSTTNGVRPHLAVSVTYDTLKRLIAAHVSEHDGSDSANAPDSANAAVSADSANATVSADSASALFAGSGGIDLDAMVGAEPAAWQDGTGPIPHTMLAQLVCDSDIARYVFGPNNEIINVGQDARLFNREQRRALRVRDSQCVFPSVRREALVDRVEVRGLCLVS